MTATTHVTHPIVSEALAILEREATHPSEGIVNSTAIARDYLRLKMADLDHEEFCCVWLNSQLEVIEFEMMFRGTVDQTAVYPREVVKSALAHNATAVVFSHNHPSGCAKPSQPDIHLTRQLEQILPIVGVEVLDHIIIGGTDYYSFDEHGLLGNSNPLLAIFHM